MSSACNSAEAAIVNYLAVDLLSRESIEIAKREYQAAVLEEGNETPRYGRARLAAR